ncbi:hypothetical protein ACO11K_004252 [Bacillus cytotoxicus]|uniref:hypothetical protein n=1 Tax=unclassified Bacillus cereus group TaxID=2750818 RepID=UPI001F5A8AEE|nr:MULTISPECIES: hypothetical protein [unclassified Bacillus cereus group]
MKKSSFFIILLLFVVTLLSACNTGDGKISKKEFKQLKKGMSISEVEKIVGGKGKKEINSADSSLVEYTYPALDGVEKDGYVYILFNDGKVDTILDYGLLKKKESTPTKTTEKAATEKQEPNNKQLDKSNIENEAESIVKDLMSISVKKIEVNENLGTDNPDDYILLLYLSFDAKNTKQTTKEMIEMYNNEIGAKVGKSLNNVQELAIFWEVPYHQKDINLAKANLERVGDKMKFKENWIAPALK